MAQMPNAVVDGIFHEGYMAGYDEGYQAAVKHGRWISTGLMEVKCDLCGAIQHELEDTNYCPNCGARMDEEG